ncbi:hypothetical protein [Edaphobacter aggregans]|uniref:hypothetical protein n=1 Tax=Edaphobacter aggregans TaxID=570835 RepID=UPI00055447DF|nr:hypothetical protein [Edaphobacter aggregans]
MPQAGRPSSKRFSLTDLADDDEPIIRTELMSPTLVPPAPEPAEKIEADPAAIPAPVPVREVIATPPAAPKSHQTRVSRQSREVAEALEPTPVVVDQHKESFYANFGERKTKKQISLRIHPDVDKALTKEVLTKNLEGITITREAIITKAVCNFLGIDYPEDM